MRRVAQLAQRCPCHCSAPSAVQPHQRWKGLAQNCLRRRSTARLLCGAVDSASVAESAEYVFRVEEDDVPPLTPLSQALLKEPPMEQGKLRLDAYLSAHLEEASRAKIQSSIRSGLVIVNSRPSQKASHSLKLGDVVRCRLPPPRRLEAEPEDLPLAIVHEDEHTLVIEKAAGMVVHPSPGHHGGTLVNALLHHCGLPPMRVASGSQPPLSLLGAEPSSGGESANSEDGESEEEPLLLEPVSASGAYVIRPGIVHRLDKGTSGLLVVAKDDVTHARLCQQFKDHTVERTYLALTIGGPGQASGKVETNIGRDARDGQKMAPFGFHSSRGRHAVSRYEVLELLAGGRAALVQWRLETGRTHQIRVHSKHAGFPILGDEVYGGGASTAVNHIGAKSSARQQAVRAAVKLLGRPALHARTLGFEHPATGQRLRFTSEPPQDFAGALEVLRGLT